MKRILSVTLILSFLLTLLPAVSAAGGESEAIWSRDFESGMLSDLGTPLSSDEDGYYASGSVYLAAGGANGSDYCLQISSAGSGNGQYIFGLEPDTAYTVSFKARQANNAGAAYPNFGVKEFNDAGDYKTVSSFTDAWADCALEFTTGASQTSVLIYTWIFGSGAVDFFVDDIKLFKTPQVVFEDPFTSWDFEDGDLSLIGTPLGSDADGYYASGTVALTSGGAGGSAYAMKISDANSGNGQYIFGLKPNTTYTISFDAKQMNNAGTAYPNVGVKEYDKDGSYKAISSITTDWAAWQLDFTTGEDCTSALFYTWIFGSGAVDLLLDNVKLAEKTVKPHEGAYLDWDFESGRTEDIGTPASSDEDGYYASGNVSVVPGGADGTAYALKISGAGSGNGQYIFDLEPETTYAISFWAKQQNNSGTAFPNIGVKEFDGTDAYYTLTSISTEWGRYALKFTTGKDCTSALFYIWIFGSGSCELMIDEVKLRALSDEETEPLADWDFEENDISVLGTPTNSDGDGYYASGNVSVVSGGADGTDYALKISGANSGNGKSIYGLKPATSYTVSFLARVENASGSAFPSIGIKDYYNTAYSKVPQPTAPYQSISSFSDSWERYSLTFMTGDNSASALLYTWIFGSGAIDLLLDEFTITENVGVTPELLPAWDFEAGSAAALGTADGNDADGYYAEKNVSVVPGGADGSAYALQISGADSGNGQYLTGLDRNAEYVLTFSAKLGAWSGTAFPSVGVNGYDGDAYVVCDKFTNDWASYELRFRTSDNSNEACVYTWIFGSGEAELLLDNVSLRRATDWFDEKEPVSDYAYAFAVVGDPQIMTQYYPEKLPKIFDWLTENIDKKKIGYVFSTGDSTHFDSDAEWERISENYRRLDGCVPYTIARGNHDSAAQYEKYIADDSYLAQFEGVYPDKPENTWRTLHIGSVDYLLMNLDNGPADDVLAWAGEVIAAHPEHSVIISTHTFLAPDGSLNAGVPPTSCGGCNDSIDIWEKLIKKYANIQLVICGHESSEPIVLAREVGDGGNTVTSLMINGQETDYAQHGGEYGGAGLVALLCFSEDGSHVQVEYYSTVRQQYFMTCNQFSFDLPVKEEKDPCEGYTDIDRSAWYHGAADYMIARGLMGSTSSGLTFEPETNVSRAMVAAVLRRIVGDTEPVEFTGAFKDVKEKDWFAQDVEWCAKNGLAYGDNGYFHPDDNVTRQELAAFIYRLTEYLGGDVSGRADFSGFADAKSVESWATDYIAWAIDAGLIKGSGSGSKLVISPKDNATRAEFATMIMRFLQSLENK